MKNSFMFSSKKEDKIVSPNPLWTHYIILGDDIILEFNLISS